MCVCVCVCAQEPYPLSSSRACFKYEGKSLADGIFGTDYSELLDNLGGKKINEYDIVLL